MSGKSKNQIPCFPCAVATLLHLGAFTFSESDVASRYSHRVAPRIKENFRFCSDKTRPNKLLQIN